MPINSGLTAKILAVFEEEIVARRGRVTDTFNDGQRLFTRSVLSQIEQVRPGDGIQHGVAMKATETEISLFPYLFRLVCRNGAIIAQALESRTVADLQLQQPDVALESIREGIAACCTEEVFSRGIHTMRAAGRGEVDVALSLLPMLSRLSAAGNHHLLSQIMQRFFREGDRSQFGLVNAVTATARDTRDPSLRWDLEELGGAILMREAPKHPIAGRKVAMVR